MMVLQLIDAQAILGSLISKYKQFMGLETE